MLSLFIATGGLGNCLVEYIYVGLQVHSVQSPKLYPFAFLNLEFQTSAGSSMIRSAVYISYIRWVTDKNGLDGDGDCIVQSMLFKFPVYNLPVFFVLSSQTSFGDIIFCSAEFLQILTVLIKLTDHPKSMPDKTCFRDMIHLSALVKTALGPAKQKMFALCALLNFM